MERPKGCLLIIFGASGDLTKRKLLPAVYALHIKDLLPETFAVLGVGRTGFSSDEFREQIKSSIETYSEKKDIDTEQLSTFARKLFYFSIDTKSPEEYKKLKEEITCIDSENKTNGNLIFYLATPPNMYQIIAENIKSAGLNSHENGYKRIIVEKPFGYDLESSNILNNKLYSVFSEDQIYRIDHYLGKETVQNLLVTRFANGIFEPLWNRNYVNHIEITSAESIGVENRGGYYDSSGALRDMVQNHLLQISALIAMEPPSSFDSDSIRNEIVKVFQSLRTIKKEDVEKYVIRGQYTSSKIRGEIVPGYREEKGVNPDSRTETFVALKFFIDNWRWLRSNAARQTVPPWD